MWALTPRAVSVFAKDRTTGVLPAPPATRLPTQITGTPARAGCATRRAQPRPPRHKAPGQRRQQPGCGAVATQNSGARSGMGRIAGRARARCAPARRRARRGCRRRCRPPPPRAPRVPPGRRAAGPRRRRDRRRRRPRSSAPAAGQRLGHGGAIAHVGAVQDGAIQQRRLDRVMAALLRQRAADEGDAGQAIEQAELAQRIGEVDVGRILDRLAARAPRHAQALRAQARPRSRRRAPDDAAR